MKIERFIVGELQSNCYIISNAKDAVIIDMGYDSNIVEDYIEKNDLQIAAVILTHGHFDHIGGVKYFQNAGAKVYVHKDDAEMLSTKSTLARIVGVAIEPFTADKLLDGGEVLHLIGLDFECIHTPGHTRGGICIKVQDNLFTGDTLFYEGIGRSDFPESDSSKLLDSIQNKLFCLEDCVKVFPGHGRASTISHEKNNNPYVLGDDLYDC